jgi:hypothetical protein
MSPRLGVGAAWAGVLLALAATAPAQETGLDVNRWDEFMEGSDSAVVVRVAARDSSGTGDTWFLAPERHAERSRPSRRWTDRFRRAFVEEPGGTAPCACTARCWGCRDLEREATLVTFHRDARALHLLFLAGEHCAVIVLDSLRLGCIRLDPSSPAWAGVLPIAPHAGAGDDSTHSELDVDELPIPIVRVDPFRPLDASSMGVRAGTVLVRALIGAEGAVHGAEAVEGPAILHDAAVECVLQWRFEPGRVGGRPVAVWASIPIVFR